MTGAGLRNQRGAWRFAWAAQPLACALLTVLAMLQGLFPPVAAALLGYIVDTVADTGTGSVAGGWALGVMAALLVIMGTTTPAGQYLERRLERASTLLARDVLYAAVTADTHLTRLESPEFRDRLHLAEEASRTSPAAVFGGSIGLVRATITLGGLLWTVGTVSSAAAVIVASAIFPQVIGEVRLSRLRLRMLREITPLERRELFYADLLTDLTAAKELRVFGSAPYFRRLMRSELRAVHQLEDTRDRGDLRHQTVLGLLSSLLAVAALAVVMWQVRQGAAPVGALGILVLTLFATPGAVAGGVQSGSQVYEASTLFGHYRDLAMPTASTSASARTQGPPPGLGPPRIVLDDVWFRYSDDSPWVLRGFSATIEAASTVALVGPNGSGKSTIIKLLCALYKPTRGRILIDGVDLDDVPPEALRRVTTAVFQDFVSYELSLAENIAVGSLDGATTLDHLDLPDRSSAAAVGLHDKAESLPAGYDTQLSRIHGRGVADTESGALLSGGEWQRLAIARALARGGRSLVLLDEPTSWLDAASASWFAAALDRLGAGATTLLVTHRLGLAQRADRVVVVERGTVVESGAPADLVSSGGSYAAMFRAQTDEMLGRV